MKRIRELNLYQKAVILFSLMITVLFLVIYCITGSKRGFKYRRSFFTLAQEDGRSVYSGKIYGKPSSFTFDGDQTLVFRYGDTVYGPYTLKKDPSAVPAGKDDMTGIELCRDRKVLFRGGMVGLGSSKVFYKEDGTLYLEVSASTGEYSMEPSVMTVLNLMTGPELVRKCDWLWWFIGAALCIFNIISVLFADELFFFSIMFRVHDAEKAEASDAEIMMRYIVWTVMALLALGCFIFGLL